MKKVYAASLKKKKKISLSACSRIFWGLELSKKSVALFLAVKVFKMCNFQDAAAVHISVS